MSVMKLLVVREYYAAKRLSEQVAGLLDQACAHAADQECTDDDTFAKAELEEPLCLNSNEQPPIWEHCTLFTLRCQMTYLLADLCVLDGELGDFRAAADMAGSCATTKRLHPSVEVVAISEATSGDKAYDFAEIGGRIIACLHSVKRHGVIAVSNRVQSYLSQLHQRITADRIRQCSSMQQHDTVSPSHVTGHTKGSALRSKRNARKKLVDQRRRQAKQQQAEREQEQQRQDEQEEAAATAVEACATPIPFRLGIYSDQQQSRSGGASANYLSALTRVQGEAKARENDLIVSRLLIEAQGLNRAESRRAAGATMYKFPLWSGSSEVEQCDPAPAAVNNYSSSDDELTDCESCAMSTLSTPSSPGSCGGSGDRCASPYPSKSAGADSRCMSLTDDEASVAPPSPVTVVSVSVLEESIKKSFNMCGTLRISKETHKNKKNHKRSTSNSSDGCSTSSDGSTFFNFTKWRLSQGSDRWCDWSDDSDSCYEGEDANGGGMWLAQ